METLKSNGKTDYNHASEGGDVNACADDKALTIASEMGADIKTGNDYPVKEASVEGHLEMIKYLIKHGEDIKNSDGPRPFNAAQWKFYFKHYKDYLNFY